MALCSCAHVKVSVLLSVHGENNQVRGIISLLLKYGVRYSHRSFFVGIGTYEFTCEFKKYKNRLKQ